MDVGNNYSVLDHPNICFVYDYVGSKDEEKSQADFVSICMSPFTTHSVGLMLQLERSLVCVCLVPPKNKKHLD